MRNLLMVGAAALALAVSGAAAFAEPNENALTNAPHGPTGQNYFDDSHSVPMTEGRSAFIYGSDQGYGQGVDQSAGGSQSFQDRQPR